MNLKITLVKPIFQISSVLLYSFFLSFILLLFIEYTGHMNFSSNDDDDDEYQYCVRVCFLLLIEQNIFNRLYVYFFFFFSRSFFFNR